MLYHHRPCRHRPIYSRASLNQSFANSGLAIDPPEPLPFADQALAIKPSPARQITPEDLGRAWAQLEKVFKPVVIFLQRLGMSYQKERRRLS